MRAPNSKEALTLRMYKGIIENDIFDEIDIISFLIYIRSLLEKADKNTFWVLYDICDYAVLQAAMTAGGA